MNNSYFRNGVMFSILIHVILFSLFFLFHMNYLPGAASSEIEVISVDMSGTDILSNPTGADTNVPLALPKFGDDINKEEQHVFAPTDIMNNNVQMKMNVMRTDAPMDLGRSQTRVIDGNPRGIADTDYKGPVPKMTAKSLIKTSDQNQGNVRGNSPFYLEGDLQESSVVYKKIPEYPKGIEKNAKVVLQFSVFPNGSVDQNSVIVIKKADPRMDDLSVESLQQWRFTQYIGRQIRKGRITFIYQIK